MIDGEYPGRTLFASPEDRSLFFCLQARPLERGQDAGTTKYIYHFGKQEEEYYDLRKDLLEKDNLIGKVGKME